MYPGVMDIVGIMFLSVCLRFFYIYGRHESRWVPWIWPVFSFAIWAGVVFLLKGGLITQMLGQFVLFVLATGVNILSERKSHIIR